MYRIVTNTFERKLYYKNTVVLKYKIEYPQILGNSFGIHRFNIFNFIKAIKLKQYSEKNLLKEAKEFIENKEIRAVAHKNNDKSLFFIVIPSFQYPEGIF